MRYEILNNIGEVTNTILADQEFIEQHYFGRYREVPETDIVINTTITKFEFLKRFTSDERKAIYAAAKTNSDIEDFKMLLDAAQEVNLAHADTINGVNALEATGLISTGRAVEILRI